MVVVAWLWWRGCGGVVVVAWLWWRGCGGVVVVTVAVVIVAVVIVCIFKHHKPNRFMKFIALKKNKNELLFI